MGVYIDFVIKITESDKIKKVVVTIKKLNAIKQLDASESAKPFQAWTG